MKLEYDVVVAGCGISGLLIGSELARHCDVLLIEQSSTVPLNKYWLTDSRCIEANPELRQCIDTEYSHLDFIAYDDTTARIRGKYHLWNTTLLVDHLTKRISHSGTRILTGHTLYSYRVDSKRLLIRANDKIISARLLVDCMGYGSPIVMAKGVTSIIGYFLLHGRTLKTRKAIDPVGLHNVMIQKRPTYFEAFPSSDGLVHASMIIPARQSRGSTSLTKDFNFVIKKSEYSSLLEEVDGESQRLFGIIPVGKRNKQSLDRIFFYGEAGQVNPATSATGLTRMLWTYKDVASFLLERLKSDSLDKRSLRPTDIPYMSGSNRTFQEALFKSLLDFTSDDFKSLVEDIGRHEDDVVNDLIFADFDFSFFKTSRMALSSLFRSRSLIGRLFLRSLVPH